MSTRRKKFSIRDQLKTLTIAQFLRSWRLCDEMSQVEFARLLKISPANLCDLEKGRKSISIAKACEIGEILGYSPTVLVRLVLQEQVRAAGLNYSVELKEAAA